MRRLAIAALVSLAVIVLGPMWCAASTAVTPEEALNWTRYVVPLPKSISIPGKVQVQCARIAILLPESSDVKVPQARRELRQALGLPDEGDDPADPAFTITLQLGGAESSSLASLANSDQAYKIFAEAGDAGLRLVALQPAGLYYAAKTLQLMLAPKVSGGSVQIPIMEVLDWPDMTDRGMWGSDTFVWSKWMGDRKMNLDEPTTTRTVSSDGKGHAGLNPGRETTYTEGPYYGVNPVPTGNHLERCGDSGLFTYHPEVQGIGGYPGAICYSQGNFTHVEADWMCDWASLPYVNEVDQWMCENLNGQGGCHCAACSLWDRSVLEATTIVAAWNEAKARLGRYFGLRILTSEETEPSNTEVFACLPSDVKIWYYQGIYTYSPGRFEIIPSNLQDVANSGRYAGVVPGLYYVGHAQPFQSAEFINYRMTEFVNKKISGLLAYAAPQPLVKFLGYNVEAAAEYSWNASGRSPHEFAASYAVRKGYADPEEFAQWADAVGTVELDLYGSEFPTCEGRTWPGGYLADLLRKGKLPTLGETYPGFRGPWGEFKSAQQFNDDLVLAAKALSLAKRMGNSEYYYESVYAQGLITALRALYKLKWLVVGGTVSEANRETARYYFGVYINGLKQSIDAIGNWCMAVDGETANADTMAGTLQDCIYGNGGANPGMLQVAIDCGCTPTLPYNAEPAITIADAKRLGPDAVVQLYGDLLTGSHGTTGFLQEPDRSAAIQVSTSSAPTNFAPCMVLGTVENVNGELVINAEIAQSVGSVESVTPLAMPLRSLGGGAFGAQPAVMEYRPVGQLRAVEGLSNLGLFVRVTGIVTYVGADHFYIDDGSMCDDGSGSLGVRAICADPAWSKPAAGDYVMIDGMSSSYFERGHTWRAVYIPSAVNIVLIPVPLEIIMDEDEAAFTGGWNHAGEAGCGYQGDYDYTASAPFENATATWTPNITRPGSYDVYVMYCEGPDRTVQAPYTINYFGGSQTYFVNQTAGGDTWQFLDRKPFAAGTAGCVQLGNATPDAGTVVVADAVRFVRVSEGSPPTVTGHPASQAVCLGATATFTVSASGSAPLWYQWRKGAAGILEGGHYSGTTTSTLTVTDCDMSDAAADYNCFVSNIFGGIGSNNAFLAVGDPAAPPIALPATDVQTDAITWNWGGAAGAIGYKLWTAPAGGTQIGGTITGASYTEHAMDPGTSHTRYVEAQYGCGASLTRTQLGPTSTAPRYCVENGDFEGGFTGGIANHWLKTADDGTSVFAQETSIKHGGASSQKIVDPVLGQVYTGWVYQKVNVQPGRQYVLRYYNYRAGAGQSAGFVMGLGCDVNGGTALTGVGETSSPFNQWVFKQSGSLTSGAGGLVSVGFRGGYNGGDSAGYADDVALVPAKPTSTGGSTTIHAGQSATITASGGFGGSSSEMHWYTGPSGTGTHAGTGTSLVVSPTVTTKYYPRWESATCSGSCCASDDGTAVTITVH